LLSDPALAQLEGQFIRVIGKIEACNGKPYMRVSSRSQISNA
jgi:hypothetical protein